VTTEDDPYWRRLQRRHESATVVLPMPPPILSPNRVSGSIRGRMQRAAATKKYRKQAKDATEAIGIESGPWTYALVRATFYHVVSRRRDGVNHNQMIKAAQDGIVAAGLVVDDDAEHWETLPPVFSVDKLSPRVEITVIGLPKKLDYMGRPLQALRSSRRQNNSTP